MKKIALILLFLPLFAIGQSAREFFLSAPAETLGSIDRNQRLDMIDYLGAGLSDRSVINARGGESRLVELTDSSFVVKNGEVQTISAHLLAGKSDTLIAVIETLLTPAPDSRLAVYNKEWKPQAKAWSAPADREWGKFSAEFLLTEYSLRGDTLTLTDRTDQWNSEGAPSVRRLLYLWNPKSKKFKLLK